MFQRIGDMTGRLTQSRGGDIRGSTMPRYRLGTRLATEGLSTLWPPTVSFFRGQDDADVSTPDHQAESRRDGVDDSPERWFLCRQCRSAVVRADDARTQDGRQRHVFTNPNGDVFEIGCFSTAPGVITVGQATAHATWFSGYAWEIALCRRCHQHLGWRYAGSDHFYGLILRALVEVESDP